MGLAELDSFRASVLKHGRELYRDLPWRRTFDPYGIWISEVMLQQTQVARVDGRWQHWLERFPTADALASASTADVLDEWQGLGYNRRALSLLRAAQQISEAGGELPHDEDGLRALPGIGPATAAGIRAFAFNLPAVYLETNVRSVFLHELFPEAEDVSDSELVSLVEKTCPQDASNPADDPRTWYYALLDYGAYLKQTLPNPSRRSRSHTRQSRFEGSRRQKRAELVRILLGATSDGLTTAQLLCALGDVEEAAGRERVGEELLLALLSELSAEGFCTKSQHRWHL